MKKLAHVLYAFVAVTVTAGLLAIEGLLAYYSAVHGLWPAFGFVVFLMLVVLAGVLKGVTVGRR